MFREMELAGAGTNMDELLAIQKKEANSEFYKWVKRNGIPRGWTPTAPR